MYVQPIKYNPNTDIINLDGPGDTWDEANWRGALNENGVDITWVRPGLRGWFTPDDTPLTHLVELTDDDTQTTSYVLTSSDPRA